MLLCKIAFTFRYTSMQLLTTYLLAYIVKVTLLSFDIFIKNTTNNLCAILPYTDLHLHNRS